MADGCRSSLLLVENLTGFPYAVSIEIKAKESSTKPGVPAMSRLRRALVLPSWSSRNSSPARRLSGLALGSRSSPTDGSIIFARTLEFAVDLKSNIIVVPRGKEYVGTAPGDKPGLSWKTKYGIVGANAFDMPVTVDGLNEKGLHVGLFYFPGFSKYQEIKAEVVGKALAPWELGVFLLGTCSDVKEAVAAAKDVLGWRGRPEGHGLRAGCALHPDRRQRRKRGS